MEYTISVKQTAGAKSEWRLQCLEWSDDNGHVARVPIKWKKKTVDGAYVGIMQLAKGMRHAMNFGIKTDGVKLTANLDPASPIFDPATVEWPVQVTKTIQLVFRAEA